MIQKCFLPDFLTIEIRQKNIKILLQQPGPTGVQQGVYISIGNSSHLCSKHRHESCIVACRMSCDGWQVTQLFQIQTHVTLRVSQNLIIMSG